MRISDWSSDVGSSDLRSPSRTTHLSPCISPSLIERGTAWPFLSTTKTEAPESAIFTAICGMRIPSRSEPISTCALTNCPGSRMLRSEEHTSELQSLMRISYAVFCLKKKQTQNNNNRIHTVRKNKHT